MVEWQTVSDAAREYGITRVTIGRWIKAGRLRTQLSELDSGTRKHLVRLVDKSAVRELAKAGVKRGRPSAEAINEKSINLENRELERVSDNFREFLDLSTEKQAQILGRIPTNTLEKLRSILAGVVAIQQTVKAFNNREAIGRAVERSKSESKEKAGNTQ